jgi:hypothetical protein
MENEKWQSDGNGDKTWSNHLARSFLVFSLPISLFPLPICLAADELPLRPNPGPEQLPPEPSWLSITAALLVVGGIIVLGWLAFRRWRNRLAMPLPPHLSALAELERIAGIKITDASAADRFYVLITDVLRRYLNARFEVNAVGKTTPELIQSVRELKQFTGDQKTLLDDLLAKADLVKFARDCPPAEAAAAFLTAVRHFIADTAPGALSPARASNR